MPQEQRPGRLSGQATSIRTAPVWDAVSAAAATRQEALGRPLRVLDLGGGSGGLAVPLAALGHHVTVVDPSPDALASLARRARESDVADRIDAHQGDAGTLSDIVTGADIDLVCCHGVLEYVDDPAATVAGLARVLAPGGLVSLVVAQRLAAVLSRALAGHFAAARAALESADGRWGDADPLPRRFDADQIRDLLAAAGLVAVEAQGVRIFGDLVPAALVDTDAERAALLDLEAAIGDHPSYAFLGHLGAALHVLAVRDGA